MPPPPLTAGLKGRYLEDEIDDDHRLLDATYPVLRLARRADRVGRRAGPVGAEHAAARRLRRRCRNRGSTAGGTASSSAPVSTYRLRLPHVAFNRKIGEFAAIHADPDGNVLSAAEWERRRDEFLPSASDDAYVASLMRPVTEPGKYASWIAPPSVGIDGKPGDFEYVKLNV